jgi:ATP-dependent exoDNAse (exonuclease V) beta subunit
MGVILDHETHVYTNTDNNERYTSVTTFISQYKKPFDKDFWSKKVAQREGVDQQTVLDNWSSITKQAQNRGTKVHLIMEQFVKDRVVEPGYEELVDSFVAKTSAIIKPNSKIESEILLYNHEHKLAGMSDLIVENDSIFHVLDFKTNKKFNFSSKYNEYFFEPVEYLQQCEFNSYTLQLSLYAYMYELMTGKRCGSLKIFYLRETNSKYWQEINCSYMKSAARDLFKDRANKLESKGTSI